MLEYLYCIQLTIFVIPSFKPPDNITLHESRVQFEEGNYVKCKIICFLSTIFKYGR